MDAEEHVVFSLCDALVILARVLSKRPEEVSVGAALAFGQLCQGQSPERVDRLLGLARHAYEAGR